MLLDEVLVGYELVGLELGLEAHACDESRGRASVSIRLPPDLKQFGPCLGFAVTVEMWTVVVVVVVVVGFFGNGPWARTEVE